MFSPPCTLVRSPTPCFRDEITTFIAVEPIHILLPKSKADEDYLLWSGILTQVCASIVRLGGSEDVPHCIDGTSHDRLSSAIQVVIRSCLDNLQQLHLSVYLSAAIQELSLHTGLPKTAPLVTGQTTEVPVTAGAGRRRRGRAVLRLAGGWSQSVCNDYCCQTVTGSC